MLKALKYSPAVEAAKEKALAAEETLEKKRAEINQQNAECKDSLDIESKKLKEKKDAEALASYEQAKKDADEALNTTMTTENSLSNWDNLEANKGQLESLFLTENIWSALPLPSMKGIALTSYLYAVKDQCRHQPVVAEGIKSLTHLYNEMLKTPIGTEVTVIYSIENTPHKTAAKIIHTKEGLNIIQVDSVNHQTEGGMQGSVSYLLPTNPPGLTPGTRIKLIEPKAGFLGDLNHTERQNDPSTCSIFSIKDARELNRNIGSESFEEKDQYGRLFLPAEFMKSTQKLSFLSKHKNEPSMNTVINSRGKTLSQIIEKHTTTLKDSRGRPILNDDETEKKINGYIAHFQEKFKDKILRELNRSDEKTIVSSVIDYDASVISAEELKKRFEARQKLQKVPTLASIKTTEEVTRQAVKLMKVINFYGPAALMQHCELHVNHLLDILKRDGKNLVTILNRIPSEKDAAFLDGLGMHLAEFFPTYRELKITLKALQMLPDDKKKLMYHALIKTLPQILSDKDIGPLVKQLISEPPKRFEIKRR